MDSCKFTKISYYQVQSHKKLSDKNKECECIRDTSFSFKRSLKIYATLNSAIDNISRFTFFDKKENKVLCRRKISDFKSNGKISTEAVWKSRRIISDYNLDSEEYYCEED